MGIDNEKIKSALDSFENDDFITAKDTLKQELHNAVNDYFKDKLELQKDLEPKPEVETKTETQDKGETSED